MQTDERPMRRVVILGGALGIALGLSLGAAAQPGPGGGAGGGRNAGPCQADMERLCADAPNEPGARHRCLQEHRAELAPACSAHLDEMHAQMMERANEVRAACPDEIARWCPDAVPGKGGLIRCLRPHTDELSPGCRKALPERGRGGPGPR